jgi:hypothetical protein
MVGALPYSTYYTLALAYDLEQHQCIQTYEE